MLSLTPSLNMAPRIAANDKKVEKSLERISSGLRVNRASDDAAGLSVAEGLRAQVMGSSQATRNIQDALQVVRVGEDGVGGMFPVIQRIRELIVRAANGTNSGTDLSALQSEIDEIKAVIPTTFEAAHQFRLALDGNPSDRILEFQVGADKGMIEQVDFNPLRDAMLDFTMKAFGYEELFNSGNFNDQLKSLFGDPAPLPSDQMPFPFPPGVTYADAFPKHLIVDPNTPDNIRSSFDLIDRTNGDLALQASYLGAASNRLEHQLNNISNYTNQAASSESTIRDADLADEEMNRTRAQITKDATTALFGQANMRSQIILQLLQSAAENGG